MKIQELAIIFVIIILPISLLLSEYTQFQIQTLKTQTEYDSKLTAATYDAIKAFQLNSTNSTESGLANSEMSDLTASVNTFRNSIMSTFRLNGYTEDELNSYIPALVYTLYDGFYMYSPYENTNHRYKIKIDDGEEQIDQITGEVLEYETDAGGNKIAKDGNGDKLYGVKPYISYSCRYVIGNTDVVITYALDNRITIQGMVQNVSNGVIEYVNKSGYLIDGITYNASSDTVKYKDVVIETEQLKEYVPLPNADSSDGGIYQYAKINGVKYYLIPRYYQEKDELGNLKYDATGNPIYLDCIVYLFNGTPLIQAKNEDGNNERFLYYKNKIENNDSAKQYYKEAYQFTNWLRDKTPLVNLTYGHAIDEIINSDGSTGIGKVWDGNTTKIFAKDHSINIENQLSNFNQHRLAVIRHKIETNLAIAIANYNDYSGATNVFQMPQIKEDEWDSITHNISLISFLQGLPIGGKIYNGYSLVTNSESDKVVLEDNIYILGKSSLGTKSYCRIGDNDIAGTGEITSNNYAGSGDNVTSAGRLNLDFERAKLLIDGDIKYYYPLKEYNASYNSIVMQNDVTTYDDIFTYMDSQREELKKAFYTALGRERASCSNYNVTAFTEQVVLTITDLGYGNSKEIVMDKGEKWSIVPVTHYSIGFTIPTGKTFKGYRYDSHSTTEAEIIVGRDRSIQIDTNITLYAIYQ